MKNLKISMILVAAVAFFCSCGDPVPPTVTLLDANATSEATFDLATAQSMEIALTGTITAENGINTVAVTRTMLDANDSVMGAAATYELTEDPAGKTEHTFTLTETLAAADVEGAAKVIYEVVVNDKKEAQNNAVYTVNVLAPTFSEGSFEWVREGSTRTVLDQFGLQWTSNAKVVQAVIKPLDGAKLYILGENDYAATNLSDITLGEEATQYKSVSCEADGTYNDVIATVYNGKTYLMNVTKGTVTTSDAGTKVTITGNYKEFTNAEVAAK